MLKASKTNFDIPYISLKALMLSSYIPEFTKAATNTLSHPFSKALNESDSAEKVSSLTVLLKDFAQSYKESKTLFEVVLFEYEALPDHRKKPFKAEIELCKSQYEKLKKMYSSRVRMFKELKLQKRNSKNINRDKTIGLYESVEKHKNSENGMYKHKPVKGGKMPDSTGDALKEIHSDLMDLEQRGQEIVCEMGEQTGLMQKANFNVLDCFYLGFSLMLIIWLCLIIYVCCILNAYYVCLLLMIVIFRLAH